MWNDIPARCWSWLDPIVYFGDDSGNVYEMHPAYLNDNGQAIRVDVQMAWSDFKAAADKHFTGVTTYLTTNGDVQPFIDIKVDFDFSPAENRPDIGTTTGGSDWDVARWEEDPAPGIPATIGRPVSGRCRSGTASSRAAASARCG